MLTLDRRHFLKTAALLPLVSALPTLPAWAMEAHGTRKLHITSRTLEVNGKSKKVYGLVDEKGRSGLTFNKGDIFDVQLINQSREPTLIHWHGLTPPWKDDGVPGVTQDLLQPDRSYAYRFPLSGAGTHWMHAHTMQEQDLLAAPLIIRNSSKADEQDVVILLHDFSFKTTAELSQALTGMDASGNMDHSKMDHSKMHHGPGGMDVNDIEYDAYLANDRTLDDPEVVKVEQGGMVRLRIINGATSTGFFIDIGALGGELIAVDGQDIKPVRGRTFPISMGQRLDIRLKLPKGKGAFPILALREGARERTGIILASTGAPVKKLSGKGEVKSGILRLELEKKLEALSPLPDRAVDLQANYELHGSMMPYEWNMKRIKPEGGEWLTVKQGQRVRISLTNRSMMAHPIHLHGHHFQIVGINGKAMKGAVRDTVLIPPEATVDFAFDAINPGKWAFHCHHLYHMVTGMMGFVEYEGFKAKA